MENPKDIDYNKMNNTQKSIVEVCDSVKFLLLEKNQRYGNAAMSPLNIFSKEGADNQIRNRLDDKLSRIKNSDTLRKNDVSDVIGYLILLSISQGWNDMTDLID